MYKYKILFWNYSEVFTKLKSVVASLQFTNCKEKTYIGKHSNNSDYDYDDYDNGHGYDHDKLLW